MTINKLTNFRGRDFDMIVFSSDGILTLLKDLWYVIADRYTISNDMSSKEDHKQLGESLIWFCSLLISIYILLFLKTCDVL